MGSEIVRHATSLRTLNPYNGDMSKLEKPFLYDNQGTRIARI
jgi:hypothetical protein